MDQDERAERLLEAALELAPAQRDGFLASACRDEPGLRRDLASLLAHAEGDPGFLRSPLLRVAVPDLAELFGADTGDPPRPLRQDGDGLPEQIGGYRILRLLGYGGTGVVYEARQQSPERSVALKLLCPGPATPDLRRRFAAEARLLGRLHHPDITQIFEAGVYDVTDPTGAVHSLPFLVLELVRGERLDRWAARAELTAAHRLRVFARVCEAVHYAHQRGIVHRDLKPANILVDGDRQPKILDFGIARAVGTDAGAVTPAGQILGSLAYMSTEQLAGDSHLVDERSDVYALGVILYQVLSGRLPFDVRHLSVAEAAARIAGTHAPPLGTLDRALSGDLSIIADKAMAKNRERRYPSAAELAADVRRHLRHQPILTRRASPAYRLRKLVRRHRGLVAAAAAAFAAGVAVGRLWRRKKLRCP